MKCEHGWETEGPESPCGCSARTRLRDEFAMAALQGLSSLQTIYDSIGWNETAKLAYEQADAMLDARDK